MNRRKYGPPKPGKGCAKRTISASKPLYDMPVDIRSIDVYDQFVQEVHP